jgi:hypothetical protein
MYKYVCIDGYGCIHSSVIYKHIHLHISRMQEHTVASAARPHPEVVLEGIEAPPLDRIPPTVALDPQNIAIPTPGVYPDGCVGPPPFGALAPFERCLRIGSTLPL